MNRIFNINSMTLFVAVISLAWAVWSGYISLKPHSLEFRLVSQVAIQPKETSSISGIQVTVDGAPIESPYLSVLELTNNGSKPIPKADFESPLELRAGESVSVIRAQVTHTIPDDIEAHVESIKESVILSPLLLNPGDTITISVLTAGGSPAFNPKARISDISDISISDARGHAGSILNIIGLGLLTLGLALSFTRIGFVVLEPAVTLSQGEATLISCTSIGAGAAMLLSFLQEVDMRTNFGAIPAFVLLVVVNFILDRFWTTKLKAKLS